MNHKPWTACHLRNLILEVNRPTRWAPTIVLTEVMGPPINGQTNELGFHWGLCHPDLIKWSYNLGPYFIPTFLTGDFLLTLEVSVQDLRCISLFFTPGWSIRWFTHPKIIEPTELTNSGFRIHPSHSRVRSVNQGKSVLDVDPSKPSCSSWLHHQVQVESQKPFVRSSIIWYLQDILAKFLRRMQSPKALNVVLYIFMNFPGV